MTHLSLETISLIISGFAIFIEIALVIVLFKIWKNCRCGKSKTRPNE